MRLDTSGTACRFFSTLTLAWACEVLVVARESIQRQAGILAWLTSVPTDHPQPKSGFLMSYCRCAENVLKTRQVFGFC